MIVFRRFLNTDPPALADVWNESHTARGSFPLRTPGLLERWVFSKPYFDPEGLIVALEDSNNQVQGYALAGFGPNAELTALDYTQGVICSVAVRPSTARKHLGADLVKQCEEYLIRHGSTTLRAGPVWPYCPFGFGLYGGTNCAGFLASDPAADPFFRSLGYEPAGTTLVFHKKLDAPLSVTDARFGMLRKRYETQVLRAAGVPSWWHECVWGTLDPVEFRMVDKLTNFIAARAVVWELEGYGWRWGFPAAGILDIQVREDLRRQGLAKLLLSQILRFLQDQFFGICELHAPENQPELVGLCRSATMEHVDTGTTYLKKVS
ncbi:MAG: GNAT family N-acetyltransferase [Planctomycetia bacterium]|nr:GNAT family N-acetyltransferase [Planctomycetia bacterium]